MYGGEGWNVAYNRPSFPMRTIEGPGGPTDLPVTLADLDRAIPKAVAALHSEEVETVLPADRTTDPTTPTTRTSSGGPVSAWAKGARDDTLRPRSDARRAAGGDASRHDGEKPPRR
jgi:hypothetical protein